MVAGSTAVTVGSVLGASRELLAALDRASASQRARHRMADDAKLQVVVPQYVQDLIRADMARTGVASGTTSERLAIADAEIEQWMVVRDLVPVWSKDFGIDSLAAAQAPSAPLNRWPGSTQILMYLVGSWLHLDGGIIDLGIVRDSVLNATNDFMIFYESMEAAALVGVENLALSINLCDDGSASALVDAIGICSSGS